MAKNIPGSYSEQRVADIGTNRDLEAEDFRQMADGQNYLFAHKGFRLGGFTWWTSPYDGTSGPRQEEELNFISRFGRITEREGGLLQCHVFGNDFVVDVNVYNLESTTDNFGEKIGTLTVERSETSDGWADNSENFVWDNIGNTANDTPQLMRFEFSISAFDSGFEIHELNLFEKIITDTNNLVGKRSKTITDSDTTTSNYVGPVQSFHESQNPDSVAVGESSEVDGILVAFTGDNNKCHVRNILDGSSLFDFDDASDTTRQVAIDGKHIAWVSNDNNCYVKDLTDGSSVQTFDSDSTSNLNGVDIDGDKVAYGGDDNTVWVRDITDGSLTRTFDSDPSSSIEDVAIDEANTQVAFGGQDNTVWVKDYSDGSDIQTYTDPSNIVDAVDINRQNNYTAFCSDGTTTGTAWVKDNSDGSEVTSYTESNDGINGIESYGDYTIYCGLFSVVKIFNHSNDAKVRVVQDYLNDPVTDVAISDTAAAFSGGVNSGSTDCLALINEEIITNLP